MPEPADHVDRSAAPSSSGREALLLVGIVCGCFVGLGALGVVVIALLGALFGAVEGASSREARATAEPARAVGFAPSAREAQREGGLRLQPLAGGHRVDMAERLEGGAPLVLAIWLPGCADCVPHLPALDALFAEVREREVEAFAVTYRGNQSYSERDVEGTSLLQHTLLDRAGRLTDSLGVRSFTVFVFDSSGDQVYRGGPPFDGALAALDALRERPR